MDISNLTPEEVTILREAMAMYNHDLNQNIRNIQANGPEMAILLKGYSDRLTVSQKLTFKIYGLSAGV